MENLSLSLGLDEVYFTEPGQVELRVTLAVSELISVELQCPLELLDSRWAEHPVVQVFIPCDRRNSGGSLLPGRNTGPRLHACGGLGAHQHLWTLLVGQAGPVQGVICELTFDPDGLPSGRWFFVMNSHSRIFSSCFLERVERRGRRCTVIEAGKSGGFQPTKGTGPAVWLRVKGPQPQLSSPSAPAPLSLSPLSLSLPAAWAAMTQIPLDSARGRTLPSPA